MEWRDGMAELVVPANGLRSEAHYWDECAQELARWGGGAWLDRDEFPVGVWDAAFAFDLACRARAVAHATQAAKVCAALERVGDDLLGVDALTGKAFRRLLEGWEQLWRG